MDNVQRGPDKGRPSKAPHLRLAKSEEGAWGKAAKERPGLLTDGPVSMSTSLRKAYQYASCVPKISQLIDVILAPEDGFEWENEKSAKGKPLLREVTGAEGAPKKAWTINKALLLEKMHAFSEDAAVDFETRRVSTLIRRIENECPETVMLPLDQKTLSELTNATLILEEAAKFLEAIADEAVLDGHMEEYENACARIYGCVGALNEIEQGLGYPLKVTVRTEEKNGVLMTLPELSEFLGEFLLCKLDENDPNAMVVPDWRTVEIDRANPWEKIKMTLVIMQQLEHLVAIARTLEVRDGKLCVAEGDVVDVDFAKQKPAE